LQRLLNVNNGQTILTSQGNELQNHMGPSHFETHQKEKRLEIFTRSARALCAKDSADSKSNFLSSNTE
jgi:hypothetical protein